MSNATHWKKLTNPDYMGSYMFDNEIKEIVVTIDYVKQENVTGADGKQEMCIVAHFKEKEYKPLILNKTNCKTITKLYKTPYIEDWKNRKICLYVKQVRAFGELVDAVRVKAEVPRVQVKTIKCEDCSSIITADYGKTAEQLAQITQSKYGKALCSKCAVEAGKNKLEENKKALDLTEQITNGNKENKDE